MHNVEKLMFEGLLKGRIKYRENENDEEIGETVVESKMVTWTYDDEEKCLENENMLTWKAKTDVMKPMETLPMWLACGTKLVEEIELDHR